MHTFPHPFEQHFCPAGHELSPKHDITQVPNPFLIDNKNFVNLT